MAASDDTTTVECVATFVLLHATVPGVETGASSTAKCDDTVIEPVTTTTTLHSVDDA